MITKFRCGLAVAMLLVLACPGLARDGDRVPYIDRVEAVIDSADPRPGNRVLLGFKVVRGVATPVGRFTSEGELLVNLDTLEFTGTNTIRAANGDLIFINIVGRLRPTSNPERFIIQVKTRFVGGTGRFTGATGGFTGVGLLRLGPGGAFVGATFTGVGAGTISSPGDDDDD